MHLARSYALIEKNEAVRERDEIPAALGMFDWEALIITIHEIAIETSALLHEGEAETATQTEIETETETGIATGTGIETERVDPDLDLPLLPHRRRARRRTVSRS